MQMMVIEYARNVLGWQDAHTTEVEPETGHPVISLLSEQQGVTDLGGTMRLGNYPCRIRPGTLAARVYDATQVTERHRHRWEFNNAFKADLEAAGLIPSGTLPDGSLVEICELRDHPYMIGSQFHPELRSRPTSPHPLFRGFVAAAIDQRRGWKAGRAMDEDATPAHVR
jgi:CTP synthase